MIRLALSFVPDKSGATSVEYALLASLIAVVIIAAVSNLGLRVSQQFSVVHANLPN